MHSLTKVHIHSTKHAERVLSTVSGEGGGDGGFIMLDFQARAAKRISQTYQCCHQAKYSTVAVFAPTERCSGAFQWKALVDVPPSLSSQQLV